MLQEEIHIHFESTHAPHLHLRSIDSLFRDYHATCTHALDSVVLIKKVIVPFRENTSRDRYNHLLIVFIQIGAMKE